MKYCGRFCTNGTNRRAHATMLRPSVVVVVVCSVVYCG